MKKKNMTSQYLSSLCVELGLTMRAGLPLGDSFLMLAEGEENAAYKLILSNVGEAVNGGRPLASALRESGGFPKYMTDMVAIGESTGRLEDVFGALSEYYNRQSAISRSIRSAVMYPSVLLMMMLIVVVILITNVLPIFDDVFAELCITMNPVTAAVMSVGIWMRENAWLLLSCAAVLIAAAAAVYLIPALRTKFLSAWKKLFPATRGISGCITSARLSSAMAMTLASGMDLDQSLDMSAKLTDDPVITEKIARCKQHIFGGDSFFEAITKESLFAPLYCRMISVGVVTGSVDTVMEQIARRCEDEATEKIASLIGRIEPTLVIILSVLVGVILLSVMFPMMGIMTSIG